MSAFWQTLAIAASIGAALVYLAARVVGWRRRRQACSECRLMQSVTSKDRNPASGDRLN
jgi:uncharacterized membrane protein YdjX (TVP38/TMEM64 family)